MVAALGRVVLWLALPVIMFVSRLCSARVARLETIGLVPWRVSALSGLLAVLLSAPCKKSGTC